MVLSIFRNELAEQVKAILSTIASPERLEFVDDERFDTIAVFREDFNSAFESPGFMIIRTLTDDPRVSDRAALQISPCQVVIRGGLPTDLVPSGARTIGEASGAGYQTQLDPNGSKFAVRVDVTIDVTFCNRLVDGVAVSDPGKGYRFNEGDPIHLVEGRVDITLAHELEHAVLAAEGTSHDLSESDEHVLVLATENDYRAHLDPPRNPRASILPVDSDCATPPRPAQMPSRPKDENPGRGPGPWWRYIEPADPLDPRSTQQLVHYYFATLSYYSKNEHLYGPKARREEGIAITLPISLSTAGPRPGFADMLAEIEGEVRAAGDVIEGLDEEHFNNDASQPRNDGCLIAESHPAGRDSEILNELRRLREGVLLRTPWGRRLFERFHEHYYSFSGGVASRLMADPEMRESIGFLIAAPLINYLRIVARSPRLDAVALESLPGELRELLQLISGDLQRWLGGITIGDELLGVPCEEAAIEIAVALRFRCRTDLERERYLQRLEREGVLPLSGTAARVEEAAALMRALGAREEELHRVLELEAP